jgi:hypothetical protein
VWWYPPAVLRREREKGWKVAQMAQVASSRVSKINILNKKLQFSALTNFKSLIQITGKSTECNVCNIIISVRGDQY